MSKQATKKEFFMRDARLNRMCVLEDLDFYWDERELKDLRRMWQRGASFDRIVVHFDRDPDEVALAIMHLARQDKIKARKTWLKGETM